MQITTALAALRNKLQWFQYCWWPEEGYGTIIRDPVIIILWIFDYHDRRSVSSIARELVDLPKVQMSVTATDDEYILPKWSPDCL